VTVSESYVAYVKEQLTGVGRLRSKRMFGGVGFYAGELFFGLLAGDALYFKVDDTNRGDFTARGMGPFTPFPDKPDQVMGYYEVPADIIEEAEALVAWARKALRVAAAAPRKARSLVADAPEPRSRKSKVSKDRPRNAR
jgi:DNA transformation protein